MPLFIPALVAALMTVLRVLLIAKIGSIIVAALAFFGFTWAVNKWGIDPAMNALDNYVGQLGSTGGTMASAMQWAGVLQFDVAISVLISAYTVKWTLTSARVFLMKV